MANDTLRAILATLGITVLGASVGAGVCALASSEGGRPGDGRTVGKPTGAKPTPPGASPTPGTTPARRDRPAMYDTHGYADDGTDRAGRRREDYVREVADMRESIARAWQLLRDTRCGYDSVLAPARNCEDRLLRLMVGHEWGKWAVRGKLADNLAACRETLGSDMYGKLHAVRRHCNNALHGGSREMTHGQVYFCLKTLEEGLNALESMTDCAAVASAA